MSGKEGSSINDFLREVRLNGSMFLAAFLMALGFPFTYFFDVTDWRLASGPVTEVAGHLSVKSHSLFLVVSDKVEERRYVVLCGNEQIGKVNVPCFPNVRKFDGVEVVAKVQAAGKEKLKLIELSVDRGSPPIVSQEFFERRYYETLAWYIQTSVFGFLGLSALVLYVSFLNTRKLK